MHNWSLSGVVEEQHGVYCVYCGGVLPGDCYVNYGVHFHR